VLANVADPASLMEMHEAQSAAGSMGLSAVALEIRRAEEIEPALEQAKTGADAVYVCTGPLMNTKRILINALANSARLPTMHSQSQYVEAGGLISYGPDVPDLFRRAGEYVDKILRGTKPGDIPVEQPTKFELIVNLKTAKAIGLEIPALFLARADEVIE
jgi:ABC-type uncharacterized transport system substrate-binding protein